MIHLGNVPASTTIYVPFATYAGSTGASVTCTGLAVTDVEIYKNGSVTQRSSDAGIALLDTDGIDFDGITGLHGFSIDLSDNTDAGFYAVGSWYWVVVSAITVDSQTVTFLAATFRICPAESITGYPKTDVHGLKGDAQSATDLQDFADAGYDPATNKVQGVVLVDTATDVTNERGKYSMGAVWIGPSANTNTVSYVDGIITNPVSTIAAAKTIADALNIRKFYTVRTGASQIAADIVGYSFEGTDWSLTTTGGSRDVGTSAFANANVIGGTFAATSGTIQWDKCRFDTGVSVGSSEVRECLFGGTLTLNAAGDYDFIDCVSDVPGATAPVFALGTGAMNIGFRRWSGGITFSGITADDVLTISGELGTINLGSPSGAADVQIRGTYKAITNVGSATVNITGAILAGDVASILADTGTDGVVVATASKTGYTLTATTGLGNQTANITGNVTGSVGSVTAGVNVAQWLGTAVATPSVAGVPEVDITHINGSVATGVGTPDVNVVSINSNTTAAARLARSAKTIAACVASGTPTTTSIPTSACTPAGAVADQFKGRIVIFDDDTATTALRGQATDITASSNSATPTFTVTSLTTAPASGDTFIIV